MGDGVGYGMAPSRFIILRQGEKKSLHIAAPEMLRLHKVCGENRRARKHSPWIFDRRLFPSVVRV